MFHGTLKTAFFANLTIKSAAKKINMVSVATQSYDWLIIATDTMFIFLAALFIVILCFNYRKTIYVSIDSRNWKHAYAYVMLTDHMPNSNDVAQKPSNFCIFFLCKG